MACVYARTGIYSLETMTNPTHSEGPPKPVRWVGGSKDDLRAFPQEVRKRVGGALWDAQRGVTAAFAKPLRNLDKRTYCPAAGASYSPQRFCQPLSVSALIRGYYLAKISELLVDLGRPLHCAAHFIPQYGSKPRSQACHIAPQCGGGTAELVRQTFVSGDISVFGMQMKLQQTEERTLTRH